MKRETLEFLERVTEYLRSRVIEESYHNSDTYRAYKILFNLKEAHWHRIRANEHMAEFKELLKDS